MRWMVLILGLSLSGCYAHYQSRYQGPPPLQTTSMAQVNAMAGAQQPAAYKVGFMEGCDSGHVSAGRNSFIFKKDTERFATDDLYKQGWDDGFSRCLSGEGVADGNYYQSYYGTNSYYAGGFNYGFYYPGYYYAPGYSLWLGYYGYPRYRNYVYSNNYYYTPWYGGHRHKGVHRGHGIARGKYNIANPPPRGGHKHKGGGHNKRRGRGGGHKSGGTHGGRFNIR